MKTNFWLPILVVIALCVGAWKMANRRPWRELTQDEFQSKVLDDPTPSLVYFDVNGQCRGADDVLANLKKNYGDRLDMWYVDSVAQPELRKTYSITNGVVFVLFKDGHELRRISAKTLIDKVNSINGGFYTDQVFQNEIEAFIGRDYSNRNVLTEFKN